MHSIAHYTHEFALMCSIVLLRITIRSLVAQKKQMPATQSLAFSFAHYIRSSIPLSLKSLYIFSITGVISLSSSVLSLALKDIEYATDL